MLELLKNQSLPYINYINTNRKGKKEKIEKNESYLPSLKTFFVLFFSLLLSLLCFRSII